MTLTPLDIHNKEFKVVLRGYSESEVDDFLDLVVKEFEALIRENGELKDRLDNLEQALERYRTIEDSLNKTLLLAQQAAEEVRQAGEKEAQLLRERAMIEAKRIVDEARAKAKQALEDYAEIRREAELFRMRMKTLLQAQLEIFEEAALKEAEESGSPFAVGRRTAGMIARYGGDGDDSGDGGDDADGADYGDGGDTAVGPGSTGGTRPELREEPREEAATIDYRGSRPAWSEPARAGQARPEPTRPSLWGEPVTAGSAPAVGSQRGPGAPPAAPGGDDPDDEEEEGW